MKSIKHASIIIKLTHAQRRDHALMAAGQAPVGFIRPPATRIEKDRKKAFKNGSHKHKARAFD